MTPNSIYFVGASVTAQKGGWAHKFFHLLKEEGLCKNRMIVNAIGGTDILFGAANHKFFLGDLNDCPPAFAFIEYSTGDLNFRRSAEVIEPFLRALVQDLRARGTKVFFINLYRSDCVGESFEANRAIYRKVSDSLGIRTIDLYLEIEKDISNDPALSAAWYRDNVHTTEEGSVDVAKRILSQVRSDLFLDVSPRAIADQYAISISPLGIDHPRGTFEYKNTGQIFEWVMVVEKESIRAVVSNNVYGAIIITGPRSGFVDVSVDGVLQGVFRGFDHNSYYERPMPVIFRDPIAPGLSLDLKLSSLRSPDFKECKVAHPDFGLPRELKVVGLLMANFEAGMENKINASEATKLLRDLRQAGNFAEGIARFLGLDSELRKSPELLYEYLSCLYLSGRFGGACEAAQEMLKLNELQKHHYVLCIKAFNRAFRYDLLTPVLSKISDGTKKELELVVGGTEVVSHLIDDSEALLSEGMISKKEILTTSDLINSLELAIKSKTPTSFIRLRDAEGCLIGPTLQNNASTQQWRDHVLSSQFGQRFVDAGGYVDARSKLTHLLADAINDADVLGVLKASQMGRLRESYAAPMQLAGNYFNYAYLAKNKTGARKIVDSCVHHEVQFILFVREFLMNGKTPFGVVGPHDSLAQVIRARAGIDFIFHQTPPETRFYPGDAQKHYPDVFKKIAKGLKKGTAGRVYFVGAGVLGKVYCNIIKQSGGIAVDVGSLLDLFAGHLHTRSPLGRIKGVEDLILVRA